MWDGTELKYTVGIGFGWGGQQTKKEGINYGPVLTDYYKKYYIDPYYDICAGQSDAPMREQATIAFAAGSGRADLSSAITATWTRESSLRPRPGGDAGATQLTSYWRNNHPELIVGNAYGTWHGRTNPKEDSFDGDPLDNIATLRNIVAFNKSLHGSYSRAAYWYGPGDAKDKSYPRGTGKDNEIRSRYAKETMSYYSKYEAFFKCLESYKP